MIWFECFFLTVACCASSHAFLSSKKIHGLTQRSQRLESTDRNRRRTTDEVSVQEFNPGDSFEEDNLGDTTEQFNWFKAWYPLTPVEILDPEIPHRYQLLGMDLVVWRDGAIEGREFGSKKKRSKKAERVGGEWRVFMDECPHRKVPLSEGRVEDDGTLLCSYHGFRFDGNGDCIDIPQISKTEEFSLERVAANPKSHCNSFPVRIIDGLLWVWPETGDDARIESALTEPKNYRLSDDVDTDRLWYGPWNYRELPYSADYFIENVVDPAHVGVSHHGIVGNRYKEQTMTLEKKSPLTKDGFSMVGVIPGRDSPTVTNYIAPCLVAIENMYGSEGAMQTLELYASPSRPGFCNHVGRQVVCKDRNGELPKVLKRFTSILVPSWLNHVLTASFLNQDAVFLHYQERYLAKTGLFISHTKSNMTNYMSPMFLTKGDYGVAKYRTWFSRMAGGFIPYKNGGSLPEANADICFDQWKSHTAKCRHCLDALANLRKARMLAFLLSGILAVWQPSPRKTLNVLCVLGTSGIGFGINSFTRKFYRQEFSHGRND